MMNRRIIKCVAKRAEKECPSSTVDPTTPKIRGELYAIIRPVLIVDEDGHLCVMLVIESENLTDQTLHLKKNYRIPMGKHAFNVKAYDMTNKKPLKAFYNIKRGCIEVVFNRGTVLPPNDKFCWRVYYRISRFRKMTAEGGFRSHFSLNPERSYQQIPIQNHEVYLRVIFKRRKEGGKRISLTVEQSNTLNIHAKIERKTDYVECCFETFNLERGSKTDITFLYQERPASHEIAVMPPAPLEVPGRPVAKMFLYVLGVVSPAVQTVIRELVSLWFRKLK